MTQRAERSRGIRLRWVIVILVMVLMLMLVATHWVWSIGAGRRLASQAAKYRAAGEPIEPEDFAAVDVVPGENAVPDLRAAAAAIDRTLKDWTAFRDANEQSALPLRPDELARFRAIRDANPKVLPLVESATRKPGIDWGLVFKTPTINVMLPDLMPQRDLAHFLQADALLAHAEGDHARSMRRVDNLLFVSRVVGNQPTLVSHLVSLGISAMASDLARDQAQDLRIGSGAGEASPQQVRALIAALIEESSLSESQRNALLGERMMELDMARAMATGKVSPAALGAPVGAGAGNSLVGLLIKPTALDDGVLMIRHTTAFMEAASAAPNWPVFQQSAPKMPAGLRENSWRHMVANILLPSFDRAVLTDFRGRLDRRLAAVCLALRLYAIDHGGALPEKLELLVPDYLAALPLDPFARTAQPLKYVPGPDPILYSIGENGVDDGGSERLPTSRPVQVNASRWDRLDNVVHYKRQPRPVPQDPDEPPIDDAIVPPPAAATEPATAL